MEFINDESPIKISDKFRSIIQIIINYLSHDIGDLSDIEYRKKIYLDFMFEILIFERLWDIIKNNKHIYTRPYDISYIFNKLCTMNDNDLKYLEIFAMCHGSKNITIFKLLDTTSIEVLQFFAEHDLGG